jgi:hypothetical protein
LGSRMSPGEQEGRGWGGGRKGLRHVAPRVAGIPRV